jgi:hypothetical protein
MTVNQEFFGVGTPLENPVTIGGVTYTYGVKWDANANAQDRVVVSGSVHSFSTATGTQKKVVFGRAFQNFSRPVPDTTPVQVQVIPALMGGNICPTTEAQRLYSSANASGSKRGGDTANKAQVNRAIKDAYGRLFRIVSVHTMAEAPGDIAWQGTDPITPVQRFVVNTASVALDLPPVGNLRHDPTEGGFWGAAIIANATTLTRKIFDSEPSYWPPAANLGTNEYWLDMVGGQVIFGTTVESAGTPIVAAYWWESQNSGTFTTSTTEFVNHQGDGETGYDDDVDDVSLFSQSVVTGSFNCIVYKRGGSFGNGAFEIRNGTDLNAAMAAVRFTSSTITVVYRDEADDALTTPSLASLPAGLFSGDFFVIRITRLDANPDEVVVAVSPDGITYTTLATFNVADFNTAGLSLQLGTGQWGTQLCQTAVTVAGTRYRDGGKVSIFKAKTLTATPWTYTAPKISTNSITEVFNVSADVAMTSSATRKRDTYSVDGSGNLVFYSESAGDAIRVTYAVDVDPPAIPGEAPRVFNMVDAATQGSEENEDNRLHWHDYIIVDDPLNLLSLTEGETVSIVDGLIFTGSPTITMSRKNGASAWQTLTNNTDYYLLAGTGCLLLSAGLMATLAVDEEPCIRIETTRAVQNGSIFADVPNELAESVGELDQAWLAVGASGGFVAQAALSGRATGGAPNINGVSSTPLITGIAFGLPANFAVDIPAPTLPYKSFPFYELRDGVTRFYDGRGESNASTEYPVVDGNWIEVTRGSDSLVPLSFVGSTYSAAVGTIANRGLVVDTASFEFNPISINVNDQLKNLASMGATVLEAKMRVRFSGLETQEWELDNDFTISNVPGSSGFPSDASARFESYVNNELVTLAVYNSSGSLVTSVNNEFTEWVSGGAVSFDVIGIRDGTRRVRHKRAIDDMVPQYGEIIELEYENYSGTLSLSSVTSDQWQVINATSIVRSMLQFCTGKSTTLALWPSSFAANYEASDGQLASFARRLLPDVSSFSATLLPDEDGFRVQYTQSGRAIRFESVEVSDIVARFQLPSGLIETVTIPIDRGPMMPEP